MPYGGGATMPVRGGFSPSPNSLGASHLGRVRSASPARRALALDMRRIANLLRDPPMAGEGSMNTSVCSSPHSALEPGDRGAAPMASARLSAGLSRLAVQNHFSALAERINAAVSGLQWQCADDRRRLAQLERKLDARLEDRSREAVSDSREKWAEIQGSVNGLIEETQALTRRVEGLDERLWARTSGSELSKQRNRELEQQVQALEHQSRLAVAAAEESQKRQATKLRRSEHAIEEAVRRLAKLEELAQHRDGYLDARVAAAEQQLEQLGAELRDVQLQLDEGLAAGPVDLPVEELQRGAHDELDASVDEALRASERGLLSLERRLTAQVEEVASSLASLRVKVDGQLQRVGTLAERLETAHAPAIESLRGEVATLRGQDRRELEAELAKLRSRLEEVMESRDDMSAEVREALRQAARAELQALGHPSMGQLQQEAEDGSMLQELDERCSAQECEIMELRSRLDALSLPVEKLDDGAGRDLAGTGADLDDALRASERAVGQLDRRLTTHIEELTANLASLKVKVDGQTQRVGSLAERLETAHVPGLESIRAEMGQQRNQDRRELEAELATLRSKVQEALDAREDDLREAVRHGRGRLNAGGGAGGEDSQAVRELETRSIAQERELHALKGRIDGLSAALQVRPAADSGKDASLLSGLDARCTAQERRVADLQARLETVAAAAASASAAGAKAPVADNSQLRELDERCAAQERELKALKSRLEAVAAPTAAPNLEDSPLLQELRRRCEAQEVELKGVKTRLDAMAAPAKSLEEEVRSLKGRVEAVAAAPAKSPDGPRLDQLERRCDAQETDLSALRAQVEALPSPTAAVGSRALALAEEREDDEAVRALGDRCSAQEAQLKALQAKVDGLPTAKSAAEDAPAWEQETERLDERLSELAGSVKELTSSLTGLSGKVDGQAGRIGGLAERLEAVPSLDALRAEMEKLRTQDRVTIDDKLAELSHSLQDVVAAKGKSGAGGGEVPEEVQEALDEMRDELKGFSKKEDSEKLDQRLKEVAGEVGELTTAVKALRAKVDEQGARLGEMGGSLEALQQLRGEVQALAQQDRSAVAGGATPGGEVQTPPGRLAADEQARARVQEKVEELTQQLAEELGSLSRHQAELAGVRATVESLSAKVAAGLPAAGAPAAAGAAGPSAAALGALTARLDDISRRVQAAEDGHGALRRELEQLQGPRKVGISMTSESFSLADVRDRLALLAEQIADLQAAPKGRGSSGGVVSSGSRLAIPTPEASGGSFNFSVSEQDEGRRPTGRAESAHEDLDYSLTEQSRRDGGSFSESVPTMMLPPQRTLPASGGLLGAGRPAPAANSGRSSPVGSLNSMPIEEADEEEDPSVSGSAPASPAAPAASTPAAPTGGGGAAGGEKPKEGEGKKEDAEERSASPAAGAAPAAEKKEGEEKGEDGTGEPGAAEAASSGGGGRPRPATLKGVESDEHRSLPRVDEETSDQDEHSQSLDSRRSGGKASPGLTRSRSPAGVITESPTSVSGGGLDPCMDMSYSCNEVSIGGDYSVEDSLELEKCDHVEEVRPMGPLQKQVAATAAAAAAAALSGSPQGSSSGAGAVGAKPAGAGGDALDLLVVGGKPKAEEASSTPPGGASAASAQARPTSSSGASEGAAPAAKAKSAPGGASPKARDEDEYGDGSFDDDMSVAEEIEEDASADEDC